MNDNNINNNTFPVETIDAPINMVNQNVTPVVDQSGDNIEMVDAEPKEKKIITPKFILIWFLVTSLLIITVLVIIPSIRNKNSSFVNNEPNTIVLAKEERYVNNKLAASVTYNYNDSGMVKSVDFYNDCNDYDLCAFLNLYSAGLYKYKYYMENDLLKNLVVIDVYAGDGLSYYLNDDLTIDHKYGYNDDFMNSDDKSIEVRYEYDSDGRVSKRTAYDNPSCIVYPMDGACEDGEVPELRSTVTYKYQKENLIEQTFSYVNGTIYQNKYEYDEHNNVTRYTVNYKIESEDNIIVDSDTYQGVNDYDGLLIVDYEYTYNNDLIDTIKVMVNLNDSTLENYIIKREYDSNNNLVKETADELIFEYTYDGDPDMSDNVTKIKTGEHIGDNIYTRKLSYKKVYFDEKNKDYLTKVNKLQTNNDSLAEYLYKENNWLSVYRFDI